MEPIDTNVTKKGTLLIKNTNSQKWHLIQMNLTTYIVVKSHGLALNEPRGHFNIETTLSIKSGKKLVFQFKFGLENCLEVFT